MTPSPSLSTTPHAGDAPDMTPFVKVPTDASTTMLRRKSLLSQPPEFFAKYFGGRAPTLEEKLFWIERSIIAMTELNVYRNNLYQVSIKKVSPFIRLSILRHDLQPCKDWKHFQQIKNELVGPDYEAVELFPSENRLIDTSNEYHLWVHSEPAYRFPFGFFEGRYVLDRPLILEESFALGAG
jgi:hypothetical protein